MRPFRATLVAAMLAAVAGPAGAGTLKCPAESVKVGNVCIDKYEASVWQIPAANTDLVKKVQKGKATLADREPLARVQPGLPDHLPQHRQLDGPPLKVLRRARRAKHLQTLLTITFTDTAGNASTRARPLDLSR